VGTGTKDDESSTGRVWSELLALKSIRLQPISAPVSTGNTFQGILCLRETANNTERYIYRDIRVTYIRVNTVKFN
jgi:hypothetical protein